MRCVFILLLVALASCFSNNNQENNRERVAISGTKNIDTLSILKLSGKQYGEATYQILKCYYEDHDFFAIEITKNNQSIKAIKLPSQKRLRIFPSKI